MAVCCFIDRIQILLFRMAGYIRAPAPDIGQLAHADKWMSLCSQFLKKAGIGLWNVSGSMGCRHTNISAYWRLLQMRNSHRINKVCAMGVFRKCPLKYQMIAGSDATYDSKECHHDRKKCHKMPPHFKNRLHIRQSTWYNLFARRYIMVSVWYILLGDMFNDMGDIVKLYSKNPETATIRLASLLSIGIGGRIRIGIVKQPVSWYTYTQKAFHQFWLPAIEKRTDYGKRFCKEKKKEMVLPLLCGGCKRKLGTERVCRNRSKSGTEKLLRQAM